MTLYSRLAAFLALLLFTAAASAGLTMSYSIDPYGPIGATSSSFVAGSLPFFDPADGVLTQVRLSVESNCTGGRITWDNEDALPTDVTIGIGVDVTVSVLSGLTAVAKPFGSGTALGVLADDPLEPSGVPDFTGPDAFGVENDGAVDVGEFLSIDPLILAMFTGLGGFDVTVDSTRSSFIRAGGRLGFAKPIGGQTDGVVTVIYDYHVPEPLTLSLFCISGGLIVNRRRRRS